jgi:hypothetical protein
MKQNGLQLLRAFFIPAVLCLLSFAAAPALAGQIIVNPNDPLCSSTATPPCYTTIQAAISNATGTDNILVEPGTYAENITLPGPIFPASISGKVTAETLLTGGSNGTAISASAGATTTIKNFTFTNAVQGIAIAANAAMNVTNNVFYNITGSAVYVDAAASTIVNNTFRNNTTAISSSVDLVVRNNIFSNNTNAMAARLIGAFTFVTNCAFYNNTNNGITVDPASTTSTNIPNSTHTGNDPLFVNTNDSPPKLDLHLRLLSPCIDAGSATNSVPPGSAHHDIGAYGGTNMDDVPFPVSGFVYTKPTDSSARFSWLPNLDYNVQGYRVYYGYSAGNYDGTDAVVSGVTVTSPINAGNVISLLVDGLTRVATAPTGTPVITSTAPQSGSLTISWTAVSGATSYNIYYKEAGASVFNTVNTLSNATSYTLGGLKNSVTYDIQVSAVAQAVYYFAITSYYVISSENDPGSKWESTRSPVAGLPVYVGTPQEGPLSNVVQGAPDQLVPLPNLQNSGCFIATAAYNSADAPPVRALRAFRDRILAANTPGRALIRWYYRNSPALAEKLNAHPAFKPFVRIALEPLVAAAFLLTVAPLPLPAMLFLSLAAAAAVVFRRRRAAGISRS